jgi:hypothetical protein
VEGPEALGEFVTVAEAASALGLSERQVRRLIARLEPTDKRQDSNRLHKGQPVALVRLLSVEALQKREGEPTGKPNGTQEAGPVDPTGKPTAGPVALSVEVAQKLAEAEKRAAVAEARADLLERELGDWKEQAGTYSERLGEALRALQQAQEETRAARLMPAGRGPGLIASQETTGSPESSPSVPSGVSAPLAQRKGFFERIRRWW